MRIGNLPAELWVGRMVQVEHKTKGRRRPQRCMLVSVNRKTVTVKPPHHGKTESVDPSLVKPVWSESPDLMEFRDQREREERKQLKKKAASARQEIAERIRATLRPEPQKGATMPTSSSADNWRVKNLPDPATKKMLSHKEILTISVEIAKHPEIYTPIRTIEEFRDAIGAQVGKDGKDIPESAARKIAKAHGIRLPGPAQRRTASTERVSELCKLVVKIADGLNVEVPARVRNWYNEVS